MPITDRLLRCALFDVMLTHKVAKSRRVACQHMTHPVRREQWIDGEVQGLGCSALKHDDLVFRTIRISEGQRWEVQG